MEDIKEKIDNLRKTLRYHSNRYYNDDAPEIEDYEYDMMMRSLQELEEKYPEEYYQEHAPCEAGP